MPDSADKETPSTPALKAEAEGDSGKNKVMPFSPSARNAGMMLPDLTRRVRVEREMPSSAALSLAVMRPALCMHRALHRSMGLRKHSHQLFPFHMHINSCCCRSYPHAGCCLTSINGRQIGLLLGV